MDRLAEGTWDKNSACVDGQSAMIAAHKANIEARRKRVSIKDIPVMKQIIKYNENDVKALYEILDYLRRHHVNESRKRIRDQLPLIRRGSNIARTLPRKRVIDDEEDDYSIINDMNDTDHEITPTNDTGRYNLRKRPRN